MENNDSISTYVESITHKTIYSKALLAVIIAKETDSVLVDALEAVLFILESSLIDAEELFKLV